jgi:PadR family transcriptional regulator, regulatory protein PadR
VSALRAREDDSAPARDLSRSPHRTGILLRAHNFFAIVELMSERGYLGEFELMLLLAVIHLGDEAYGVPISRELEKNRGKDVAVGSVYAALERLEAKGLVTSMLGDPTPERGGKAKRFFRITKEGLRQVHETRRVLTRLWQTIPDLKMNLS